jgi:hypothetical protein
MAHLQQAEAREVLASAWVAPALLWVERVSRSRSALVRVSVWAGLGLALP